MSLTSESSERTVYANRSRETSTQRMAMLNAMTACVARNLNFSICFVFSFAFGLH